MDAVKHRLVSNLNTFDDGFSLLELMMAVGISGVLLAGAYNLFERTNWGQQVMSQFYDLQHVRDKITSSISCQRTFRDSSCGGDILDKQGRVLVAASGTQLGKYTARPKCSSGEIMVEVAAFEAGSSQAFLKDARNGKELNWATLTPMVFPAGLSPCEAREINLSLPRPVRVFQGSGTQTYTVPDNVFAIKVELWGGGGAGGQCVQGGRGGGGGGGAYAADVFAVRPGQTFQVTTGSRGQPVSGLQTGNPGGPTRFDSLLEAGGGQAGSFMNVAPCTSNCVPFPVPLIPGGRGGVAPNARVSVAGEPGNEGAGPGHGLGEAGAAGVTAGRSPGQNAEMGSGGYGDFSACGSTPPTASRGHAGTVLISIP